MAGPVYLADTSVYVAQSRSPEVRQRFEGLMAAGRLAVCQMVAMEYLNNAPSPKVYEALWAGLHGQRWMDVTTAVMTRALALHPVVAKANQHMPFQLPGLI